MSTATQATAAKSSNRRAAVPAIALTAKQKRLVRESFGKLEPALDLVGQLFFHKLYRLDPTFRDRFAGTPQTQGRKFMAALKLPSSRSSTRTGWRRRSSCSASAIASSASKFATTA